MKYLNVTILGFGMFASLSALAANKGQISAAINVSNLENITQISDPVTDQPRCWGCRYLVLTGNDSNGVSAQETIDVKQDGVDQYSAKVRK